MVLKRSIIIAGHKTSVSLEDAFWTSLKEIASARGMTISGLVAMVTSAREHGIYRPPFGYSCSMHFGEEPTVLIFLAARYSSLMTSLRSWN